jgi:hypothetical protein
MLQLAFPPLQRVTVGVRFGAPLRSRSGLHDAALASMRALMSQA